MKKEVFMLSFRKHRVLYSTILLLLGLLISQLVQGYARSLPDLKPSQVTYNNF